MADEHSFDIASKIDLQEVLNAEQQATKEISQRFDFKGSKSSIELNKDNRMDILNISFFICEIEELFSPSGNML